MPARHRSALASLSPVAVSSRRPRARARRTQCAIRAGPPGSVTADGGSSVEAMRRLAFMLVAWVALGAQDAVRADTPFGCRRIYDFVKDIEAGSSPWLLDARFRLIESSTDKDETVRRYAMHLPMFGASEVMQLEIA